MEAGKPIIEYASALPQSVDVLTLEETADQVCVSFRAPSNRALCMNFIATACVGSIQFVMPIIAIFLEWIALGRLGPGMPAQFFNQSNPFADPSLWRGLAMWLLAVTFWWVCAIYEWRKYRRFGRVSRTLLADKDGLTFSWLGWSKIRHKHWPVNEITAIEFRPIKKNLDRWNTVADLKILFRGKRARRFRLSSRDPLLPAKIAERIRAMLNLPQV